MSHHHSERQKYHIMLSTGPFKRVWQSQNTWKDRKQTNSMAFSLQVNYTDQSTAAGQ
jgi:hypothetical protein